MTYFSRWDAHQRFFTACVITVAAMVLVPNFSLPMRGILGWDVFAFSTLVLSWITICTADPYEARRNVRIQDSSRTVLFIAVVSAATASLVAVAFLLSTAKDLKGARLDGHIALSLVAVFLSWAMIHTLFALRYAHYYYEDAATMDRNKVEGGLIFPREENPDYLDFAYYSFVVGMTAQVSDVQVASRRIRRVTMVHGLISFLFNSAILAIFVNIVASLL